MAFRYLSLSLALSLSPPHICVYLTVKSLRFNLKNSTISQRKKILYLNLQTEEVEKQNKI